MEQTTRKSTFVTVIAWIVIVATGMGISISIIQNIMVYFFFPLEKMRETLTSPETQGRIPDIFLFMFNNFRTLILIPLTGSIVTFISGNASRSSAIHFLKFSTINFLEHSVINYIRSDKLLCVLYFSLTEYFLNKPPSN